MSRLYDRVALIGLGLIASSMAHAMRAGGLAASLQWIAHGEESFTVVPPTG